MVDKLKKIAKNAYVPYSNFHVATILEFNDGTCYSGFNIENAAYPSGMCAERVAIFSFVNINQGVKKFFDLKTIHIYSPDLKKGYLSPCGGCRQVISEFISSNVELKMYSSNGNYISEKIGNIIPYTFTDKELKGE